MNNLPDAISARAYRARNGELAWRRADVSAALAAIENAGRAVLGGEVWLTTSEGRWHGVIPDSCGGSPGVWHWECLPRAYGEDWPAYCRRTASESAQAVNAMRVEESVDSAIRDQIYFNFTLIGENEADEL